MSKIKLEAFIEEQKKLLDRFKSFWEANQAFSQDLNAWPNDHHPGDWDDQFGLFCDSLERCPFCGIMTTNPCDQPPPDVCSQAIEVTYGDPTK